MGTLRGLAVLVDVHCRVSFGPGLAFHAVGFVLFAWPTTERRFRLVVIGFENAEAGELVMLCEVRKYIFNRKCFAVFLGLENLSDRFRPVRLVVFFR